MLYVKKPVIVEAVQWKGETAADAIDFMIENNIPDDILSFMRDADGTLIITIKTLEGEMRAMPGDWIIQGIRGEYYPCKPDIFEKTYAVAEPYEKRRDYKNLHDDLQETPYWSGIVTCPDCGKMFRVVLQGEQLVRTRWPIL